MNRKTHLEDLSNEIFFEIFDYLHMVHIFTGFTLLNKRISNILKSIPLHIVISFGNSRQQIDFLLYHLTFHEDQVISINILDRIRDHSSIIHVLFNRHNFINLKSCKFLSIHSMTKLNNIIKQIGNLNKLVILEIFQPDRADLNENENDELTRILLTNKSSSLRSLKLQYPNHYLNISNYTFINSNLTSLRLRISGSSSTVSIHTILQIFRLCYRIRYLGIALQHEKRFENNINVSNPVSPILNENDLPILSQLTNFHLFIGASCDIWSISSILHCMPNLKHFYFYLFVQTSSWSFTNQYLDGYIWQQILENNLSHLSKFEFHMTVTKRIPKLDLDFVINSFNYFVKKYSNWNMIIDRWIYGSRLQDELIILRTMNYIKGKFTVKINIPCIHCRTFETRTTERTIDDHYSFYSDITQLKLYIQNKKSNVTCSSPLFQNVTNLLVEMPIIKSSWWNNLFNIVYFQQTTNDNNAQENLSYLSKFVHLTNITTLEFPSAFHVSRWKDTEFILKSCPNVNILIINTSLLLFSKIINNLSLIPIFKRIKVIKSITEDIYFPSNFILKFVERFPSLVHIELQVFSFDICSFIIEVFLTKLEQLSYVKINYHQDTLLDDYFTREYIITKRRKVFPINIINQQMVNVKNNGQIIELWLS
ncbi:unnamed protein product [Rotaria magnacalcarata]|uniref:F-box domain-containing protein n=1 Tax=Rotaria magnacalcarata TaxID=392030 RepID=A0A820ECK4_9BILA|nr:unnamed protein product [Rotaria magnacalcarata]CAF4244237.1 unnamed protein product [Rotaria magnacalcarata]